MFTFIYQHLYDHALSIFQLVRDQKLHFKSNNDAEVLVDTVKVHAPFKI
jgi:hypothetical protein